MADKPFNMRQGGQGGRTCNWDSEMETEPSDINSCFVSIASSGCMYLFLTREMKGTCMPVGEYGHIFNTSILSIG